MGVCRSIPHASARTGCVSTRPGLSVDVGIRPPVGVAGRSYSHSHKAAQIWFGAAVPVQMWQEQAQSRRRCGRAGFGAAVLPTSSGCTPAQTHSRTHMRTRSHSISHAQIARTQMARVTRARDNRTHTSHAWHTNTHAHAHVHAHVCTNAHARTHARTHARALDGCSFVRSASTARTTSS